MNAKPVALNHARLSPLSKNFDARVGNQIEYFVQ